MNNKYNIFYHVYIFLDWFHIVEDQLNNLKNSGLLNESKLNIGIVHTSNASKEIKKIEGLLSNYYNYEIMFIKHTESTAESDTIKKIKEFSDTCSTNEKILYIHTKGVTQQLTENEIPCINWRKMMEYFLVENWKKCVSILDTGYDCCGINYQNHGVVIDGVSKLIKIFNGNFFWVTTDYVKKINKQFKFEHKYSSENWILSVEHKAYSFFDTPQNINLYKDIFLEYK